MTQPEELTKAQIQELHAELIQLKDELDGQLEAAKEDVRAVEPDDAIGRLTRLDAMQQQKMAIEKRRRREIRRQQVQGALDAIESGDYGFCKRCEEPVGYPRLSARPESPFCVPCMGAIERR